MKDILNIVKFLYDLMDDFDEEDVDVSEEQLLAFSKEHLTDILYELTSSILESDEDTVIEIEHKDNGLLGIGLEMVQTCEESSDLETTYYFTEIKSPEFRNIDELRLLEQTAMRLIEDFRIAYNKIQEGEVFTF